MKSAANLPKNYKPFQVIDFKHNHRLGMKSNFFSVGICIALYYLIFKIAPYFGASLKGYDQFSPYFVAVGAVVCYAVHELIHGVVMALLCRDPLPKFRADGFFAYVGSKAFFDCGSYLLISFAPIVTIVLVLCLIVVIMGIEMFWSAALLIIFNLATAAGDFIVAFHLLYKMPVDTMVQDLGVTRVFFSASPDVTPIPLKKL